MPYEEPEPDDPCALVGAVVPGSEEADEEMAECFIEEFAFLGFGEGRILHMFRQPQYRATYRLWVERGEAWVRERIAAVKGRFKRVDPCAEDEAWRANAGATIAGTGTGTKRAEG